MGCGASSGGKKTKPVKVERLGFEDTQIPEFDSFFQKCQAPSDTIVDMQNTLNACTENLKMAAAAMTGGMSVMVNADGSFECTKYDQDAKKVAVKKGEDCSDMSGKVNEDIKKKFEAATTQQDHLKSALVPGQTLEVSAGYLDYKVEEGADPNLTVEEAVSQFNAAIKELREAITSAVSVSTAIKELFEKLKKTLEEQKDKLSSGSAPDLLTLTATPPNFEDLSVSLNQDLMQYLPLPVKLLWEALNKLVENLTKLFGQCLQLQPQITELATECKEMPGKAKDAATNAGLAMMDSLKAVKTTGNNCGKFGNVPGQLTGLMSAATKVVGEVKDAITGNK